MSSKPAITLFFLQASRAIRTAWLLEELRVPYDVVFSERTDKGLGTTEFKNQIGTKLGKSPAIKDGDLTIQESIAISDYLCEKYDTASRLIPTSYPERARVREWIAASEAAFCIHALPILYFKRAFPGEEHEGLMQEATEKMGHAVKGDFDWLEEELGKSSGKYLCGDKLTAADIMVQFSVQFILARKMGTEGGNWKNVQRWMKDMEKEDSYQRAVKKTGYKL